MKRCPVVGQLSLLEHCLDERDRRCWLCACEHRLRGAGQARVDHELHTDPVHAAAARVIEGLEVEEAAPELCELPALRDRR